jgi:hypothetical protein
LYCRKTGRKVERFIVGGRMRDSGFCTVSECDGGGGVGVTVREIRDGIQGSLFAKMC